MKSVYAKLIQGFVLTILLSFIVALTISNHDIKLKTSSVIKTELSSINQFVGNMIQTYGFIEGDIILEQFGKLNNIEIHLTLETGDSLSYGTSMGFYDNNPSSHFNSQGIRLNEEFLNVGDIYYSIDRYTIQDSVFYVGAYRTIEYDRYVFFEMAGLLLGWITIFGLIIFLIIARIIVRPITRLSLAQSELAKGNYRSRVNFSGDDEFSMLGQGFNEMALQISKNEEIRQRFISDVSHEFQTPLTSIQGFSKIIAEETLEIEQYKKYGNIILHNSKRLSTLSSDMLQLTMLENEAYNLNKINFSLTKQLGFIVDNFSQESKDLSVDILYDSQLKDITIFGDKDRYEQVWINLLSNALKYTSGFGNSVKIILRKRQSLVEVLFIDNGIGISKNEIYNIFDRFYRVDKSRTNKGTGLGLSIVKSILDLHDATIDIDSIENKGTTFVVKIPVINSKSNVERE